MMMTLQNTVRSSSPSFSPARSRTLQRKCSCGGNPAGGGQCEECKKKRAALQRASAGHGTGVGMAPPIVHEVLRSPGRPLDAKTRAYFEPRFGHDFGRVRIHADARANESARSVNAIAYAVGQQIVFGAGVYQPGTVSGARLLAHELTHVLQQSETAKNPSSLRVGEIDSPFEREADRIANAVLSNRADTKPARLGAAVIQRQEEPGSGSQQQSGGGNQQQPQGGDKGTTNYHFQSKSGFDVCIYCACSGEDKGCGEKLIGKVTAGKCPPGKRVEWDKSGWLGCKQKETDLDTDPCPNSTHSCL